MRKIKIKRVKMKKIIYLISALFLLIIFVGHSSAIVSNSSNYSIDRFASGIAGSETQSISYESRTLTTVENLGTRNSESDSFSANVGFFNNTVPFQTLAITSYSIYPTSAVVGNIIRLGISALNAQTVWIKLTAPDNSTTNLSLTNNGYAYYTSSQIGRHNLVFYANDSSGAIASALDSFDITANVSGTTTTTTIIGSGGGGGTTTTTCNYVWECTSWSICSDHKQIRACVNTKATLSCTGTKDKPEEIRICSESLFDIKLNFDQLEISKEKKLIFSLDLIQTKSFEKIDVQIKYSVFKINSEDGSIIGGVIEDLQDSRKGRKITKYESEIFSQIETRAVEKSLSYKKILDEVNIVPGEYTLKAEIIYGDQQKASAERMFIVNENFGIEDIPESNFIKIFSNFIIAIVIIFVFVLIIITVVALFRTILNRRKNNWTGEFRV